MHQRKIKRLFKNFSIYKDLYGKPCKHDCVAKVVFLIQMLLTFGGRCNRYFWDIRLKILRLPNFNMLFQLVLTKFFKSELFSCLPKVDHVTTVLQRAYWSNLWICKANFRIYKDLYGKPCKRDWVAKVVFLIQNASNFRWPLQSLLLRYMAENSQVT